MCIVQATYPESSMAVTCVLGVDQSESAAMAESAIRFDKARLH